MAANGSSDAPRLERRTLYDMVSVQSTCRWSNCNEPCSDTFIAMPRLEGNSGEKMWDHSHCNGKGMQTFCCPSQTLGEYQTMCLWRGHKNDGNCNAGCESDEIEVGSL
jgi:hypothetical protein